MLDLFIHLFILVSYLSVFVTIFVFCFCLVIQISCILETCPRFSIALYNVESLDLKSNILYDFFCDFILLYVLLQCMSILVVEIKIKIKKKKKRAPKLEFARFAKTPISSLF